jgi:hypothetical protein
LTIVEDLLVEMMDDDSAFGLTFDGEKSIAATARFAAFPFLNRKLDHVRGQEYPEVFFRASRWNVWAKVSYFGAVMGA